jgi:hypothetical protein
VTGADGAFAFVGINAIEAATLTASAPGFMTTETALTLRDVASGTASLLRVTLGLLHCPTIGGTVTDETGSPAVGALVHLLRRFDEHEYVIYRHVATARADDHGSYRVGSLQPGRYIVFVPGALVVAAETSSEGEVLNARARGAAAFEMLLRRPAPEAGNRASDNRVLRRPPPALRAPDGRPEPGTYENVFVPGDNGLARWSALSVAAGQELSDIDVVMRVVRAASISGIVRSTEGSVRGAVLRLHPIFPDDIELDDAASEQTAIADAQGLFTFLRVPPGSFEIQVVREFTSDTVGSFIEGAGSTGLVGRTSAAAGTARDESRFGQARVDVGPGNHDGVEVALSTGLAVGGRVVFGPDAGPSAPTRTVGIRLVGPTSFGSRGRVTARPDGTFMTSAYPPGRYRLVVDVPAGLGWAVESVVRDGADILEEGLVLTDHDVTNLTVTVRTRTGHVAGSVVRGQTSGRPQFGSVVLYPATNDRCDVDQWPIPSSRIAALTPSDEFQFTHVIPGSYCVLAVRDVSSIDLEGSTTAARVRRFAIKAAQRVAVAEGTSVVRGLEFAQ